MAKLKDCDKRCLKAGHWVVTNVDTGERQHIVQYTVMERRAARDRFICKNEKLLLSVWKEGHQYGCVRKDSMKKVVDKARKKLDYSPKTSNADIFRLLIDRYRSMFKPPYINGCTCWYCKYRGRHD